MRQHRFMIIAALLLTSSMSAGCWFFGHRDQAPAKENASDVVPYSILDDRMGTIIRIGVNSPIGEKELRATLSKAADEHQDDAARDYLASMFLRIEAYLVKDGRRSTKAAGNIQRYVPPGNPDERRKLTIDRTKGDTFTISIEEAIRTLN